jgi:hypothetical protein
MTSSQHQSKSLFKIICYSVIILTSQVHESRAEDSCSDILARDLANKSIVATNSDSSLAVHHAQCIKSDASSASSTSTNAGASGGGYGIDYGDRSGRSAQQSSSDCGSQSSDEHVSAALYYSQSVYHDVVESWKACMLQRHEFGCWPAKHGDAQHLTIYVDWNILSARPTVTNSKAPRKILLAKSLRI